jgi:hypothetical protein
MLKPSTALAECPRTRADAFPENFFRSGRIGRFTDDVLSGEKRTAPAGAEGQPGPPTFLSQ